VRLGERFGKKKTKKDDGAKGPHEGAAIALDHAGGHPG
jgi:hypothetical protein